MNIRSDGKTEVKRGEALPQGHTTRWGIGEAVSSDCTSGPGIYHCPVFCHPMPPQWGGHFGKIKVTLALTTPCCLLLISLREAGALPSVLSPLPATSLFPVLMPLGISR